MTSVVRHESDASLRARMATGARRLRAARPCVWCGVVAVRSCGSMTGEAREARAAAATLGAPVGGMLMGYGKEGRASERRGGTSHGTTEIAQYVLYSLLVAWLLLPFSRSSHDTNNEYNLILCDAVAHDSCHHAFRLLCPAKRGRD